MVPQPRIAPKLLPRRVAIRKVAASSTGAMAIWAMVASVQNSRIPQKPSTKNSPAGKMAAATAPKTMTESEKLSGVLR